MSQQKQKAIWPQSLKKVIAVMQNRAFYWLQNQKEPIAVMQNKGIGWLHIPKRAIAVKKITLIFDRISQKSKCSQWNHGKCMTAISKFSK